MGVFEHEINHDWYNAIMRGKWRDNSGRMVRVKGGFGAVPIAKRVAGLPCHFREEITTEYSDKELGLCTA